MLSVMPRSTPTPSPLYEGTIVGSAGVTVRRARLNEAVHAEEAGEAKPRPYGTRERSSEVRA
jgi:hypothetical protein